MDIGSMAAAMASMKTATDIATALLGFKTDAAVQSKAVELTGALLQVQQQLLGAQVEQMKLIKQIDQLEAKLREAQKQDELVHQYQLHRFETGQNAYVLRPEFRNGEQSSYVCSLCFEKDRCAITLHTNGDNEHLFCPSCRMCIRIAPARPIEAYQSPNMRI